MLKSIRRHQWLALFVIIGGLLFLEYAVRTPWALHIGGRSTLDEQWDGFGHVQTDRGGRYVLYVHLQGGMLGTSPALRSTSAPGPADNLHGTAELCTESGVTHSFNLAGVVHAWWTTDDAPTSIGLSGGTPVRLPAGWVVVLTGQWRGALLTLASPDNSFTEVFTPRGEIRHVTSSADAGTARVTLEYGSRDGFVAACRTLSGH
jgi:hypothetical protein